MRTCVLTNNSHSMLAGGLAAILGSAAVYLIAGH